MIEAERLSRINVIEVNRKENWMYYSERSATHPKKEWNFSLNLADFETQFQVTVPEGRYNFEQLDHLIEKLRKS